MDNNKINKKNKIKNIKFKIIFRFIARLPFLDCAFNDEVIE